MRRDTPFSREEVGRVAALARKLGSDSDGLSGEDRAEIRHLVYAIGAEHGDPNEAYNPKGDTTGSPGHVALLAGIALFLSGGVWAVVSYIRANW
ncbi:hypothetical protein ACIBAG_35635 [Streptomyces sp. NPDC051243]|uniref:hypothetical protein n=1 Tax=Streptomyces sp. NPDC051243 TaxID=3365646 RepID=UPI00378E701F